MLLKRISVYNIPPFKLRKADEMECLAAGISPEIAVKRSVEASANAFAQYADDELLCMWGFRFEDREGKEARMWLLSTDAVEKHKVFFARASKRMLDVLLQEAQVIRVLVHTRHTLAIGWLRWLGFQHQEDYNEHFMIMRRTR
jgi:hypothetical protein